MDDDTTWHIYTNPVVVNDSGFHVVYFYSVDNAGNVEEQQTTVFNLDSVKPTVALVYPVGGETFSGVVDVLWDASDDMVEPVISLYYSPDNGVEWYVIALNEENDGVYSWNTTTLVDGSYLLKVTACDNAGNEESDVSGVFTLANGVSPPEIDVEITKPAEGGFYLFNNRVLPLPGNLVVIVGSVDVEADVFVDGGVVERVEFYVDDVLKATDDAAPYVWTWSEKTFFRHTIKAVAYDAAGNYGIDEITVVRFL